MGSGVVDDEQAAGAKHAAQMRPPTGIFRPLGVQENQIKNAIGEAFEQAARVVLNLRDRRSQTGPREVFCREIDLVLRLFYGVTDPPMSRAALASQSVE